MTESYNKYISPYLTPFPKKLDTRYESKIAFVTTPYGAVVYKKLFYVEFGNLNEKSDFFYDKNDYLIGIIESVRFSNNNSTYLEKSNNYISSVQATPHYYSYVKIIEDKQNPQLVGNVMILKFGRQIKAMIENSSYPSQNPFSFVFNIKVKLRNGFPTYEDSHFINDYMNIYDNNLNLESELYFKTIDVTSFERKEKLQKINKLQDEIEEWVCE